MKNIISIAVLSVISLSFNGCSKTVPVSQIGNNLYTISYYNRGKTYNSASEYCNSKKLMLKAIKERTVRYQGYSDTILDFKCLSFDNKEYKLNDLYDTTDISIKTNLKADVKINHK